MRVPWTSRRGFLRRCASFGAAVWCSRAGADASAQPTDFERAARALQDAVARGEIPGVVLHVRSRGQVLFERGFALTPDALFPVASLTKPVVAAAILKLAETGALRVGDPVAAYIPEFSHPRVLVSYDAATGAMTTRPARRQIVLRDLLTHTAGIHHGHVEIDPVLGKIYEKAGVAHDSRLMLADTMKRLGPLPLAHDPGTEWSYGLSSDVLGRVIEVVTGQPLDAYLARAIFEPLAMRRTWFFLPPEERDAVVSRYTYASGTLRARSRDPHEREARYLSGGGGLHTTIGDYARFAEALVEGGSPILSRASVGAMTANQIGALSAFGFRWGYSVAVSTADARGRSPLPVGGFGWYGIFGTWFWAMPARRTVVLMFTNVLRDDMTLPLFARVVDDLT